MSQAIRANLTRELAAARRVNGTVAAHALDGLTIFSDAYLLQESVRSELGAKVVGWKVAAPSSEVISAPILDTACIVTGTVLSDIATLRDGVECELALRIDRPLPSGGCTPSDVMAAVGDILPAFELLCSRLPAGFASARQHIVADGMGNGAVVLGAPCSEWRTLEFDKLRVRLWVNEELVVDKHGGNPFGDPFAAVALLTNHLALRGQALAVGTFVLAGSHTGVYRAQPGERLRCVFEGVGQVALELSEAAPTTSKEQPHVGR
ncbi:MAG: fumarylacetoacetate hydrolase family protein [Burkholderiaceae bacterium]